MYMERREIIAMERIKELREKAFKLINEASTENQLEELRVSLLGKKGEVTQILK